MARPRSVEPTVELPTRKRRRSDRPSNGNGFPAPPQWLHKLGRFWGNGEDPGRVDEDVESASRQQFDRKSATSRQFLKRCCTNATPGASTTRLASAASEVEWCPERAENSRESRGTSLGSGPLRSTP